MPEPGDEEKGRGVVRAQRGSAAIRLRRNLDGVSRGPWHQVQADTGAASGLWLLDDLAERGGRADPSQGNAGDPDDGRGARRLDARAVG